MSRWEGLEEFIAVAELSSFSKAAARLGASPAHVSRQVARLEERLHTPLFYRTTRRVNLTAAGEAFLDGCQRLASETEAMITSAMDASGAPVGLLRVLAPREFGERFVAPLLGEFAAAHPRVEVDLELVDLPIDIAVERWDMAIMVGPIAESSLMATKLAPLRMRLWAAPEYLARHGAPETLDDLANHACLLGSAPGWVLTENGEERVYRPRARWRCNSWGVLLEATLRGQGISYLADHTVRDHAPRGELVEVLPQNAPADRGFWATYPHHRLRSPKVAMLLAHLRKGLAGAELEL